MSEFIQFEAKEGKEENDEDDILEHIVGEELNSTDEGKEEDDSNASDVDEYGNLKDFVVLDEELSTSESSDTSPDTSKVENWSPELRHGITAIKLALKKKRIEELNSDENEEETTDAKNLKDSDKPGTSKDN